ncbi:MAG TPA: type VI secretion system baseplate subunit TssE [Stellaceae bacterium]|jgi:type VI secretion system protein ImpF
MSERTPRNREREPAPVAQLSLLDRLDDEAPDQLRDPPPSAGDSLAALRRNVRRDLEALLNTRRRWRSWPDRFTELALSPIGYGITDFAAGAFNDPARRDQLRSEIEQTIRRFEPRLARVRVTLVEAGDRLDATLRLRVDALLRTEPAPEPVAFDTLVDAATAEIAVRANLSPRLQIPDDV